MWFVATSPALCRAGGDVGRDGRRDRWRRRKHDTRADVLERGARAESRHGLLRESGDAAALSGHRVQPVHRRRDDGQEVRPLQGTAARKSAVAGKSASERVDIGCRRNNKKKKEL